MLKVGGHLSTSGGLSTAFLKSQEIGANTFQIFSNSPRMWASRTISSEQILQFVKAKQELHIDPIYFHAPYILNLADAAEIGRKSVECLISELRLAHALSIKGTIVHVGSLKDNDKNIGFKTVIKNIKMVLENTPEETLFIIENAGSHKIGASLEEIGQLVSELNNPRIRVCLDTCHLFAAGYDISTQEKFDVFFEKFDQLIGLEKLEVFQVNDSKDSLGSFRDRHENIGKGTIGLETFRLLLNNSLTKNIPFILEVPGENKSGPNKANVDILKGLVDDRVKKPGD